MRFRNDFRTPIEESERPPVDILVDKHKDIHQYCLDMRDVAPTIRVHNLVLRPLYLALDNSAEFGCKWTAGPCFCYNGAIIYGVCPNSDAGTTPWLHYEVQVTVDVYMLELAPRICFYPRGIIESDMNDTDIEIAHLLHTLAGLRKQWHNTRVYLQRLSNHLQDKTEKYFHANNLSDVSIEGRNEFAEYIVYNITSREPCEQVLKLMDIFADKIELKEFNQKKEEE